RGLKYRDRARAGVWIGPLPGVDLASVETKGTSRFRTRRHPLLPAFADLPRQELLDHRCLSCLLQQEAVVAVRRVDDVELDILAQRAQGSGEFLGACRRIQPVRAERNQQRSRLD